MNYLGRETGSFGFAWPGHYPPLQVEFIQLSLSSPTTSKTVSDIPRPSFGPFALELFTTTAAFSLFKFQLSCHHLSDPDHFYLNVLLCSHSQLHHSVLYLTFFIAPIFSDTFIFHFILIIFLTFWYYHFEGNANYLHFFFLISSYFISSTIVCKFLQSRNFIYLIYHCNLNT